MRVIVIVLVMMALIVFIPQSFFTVDRAEFVYRTEFGRHVDTFDGEDPGEAGFHLKWPWPVQSVQRLDRRLQYFDLPAAELLTHDPLGRTIDKTLTIDGYVCWRIAGKEGADRFIRTVGTPDRARTLLGQRINSELGAAVGQMELDDLISAGRIAGDPVAAAACVMLVPGGGPLALAQVLVLDLSRVARNREWLRLRLLSESGLEDTGAGGGLRELAREEYGIEIVDIRIRRINHPPQVRQAIFDRIVSERNTKVAYHQSEGERRAADIRSAAEREAREIVAEAQAEDRRLRGTAEAEADHIRNEAHARDVQFYVFLKKLEEYQRILGDSKSMLLLSTHRDLFDLLLRPPRPEGTVPPKPAEAAPAQEPAKTGGQ
jgi:membrane protease subunit HflC